MVLNIRFVWGERYEYKNDRREVCGVCINVMI